MIRKKKLKLKGKKKIKYFDINNNKFYTIEDKKDVLKFINNYNKKQLTNNDTYYKVEPLLQNFRPLVLTANENTFIDIVINNNENVFVYFYFPFSSLSKRLFKILAKKFNIRKNNIKFVEIDGTKKLLKELIFKVIQHYIFIKKFKRYANCL